MEIAKYCIIFLIAIDIFSSIISFIDFIPIGKSFASPRFPLFVTLILIIAQMKQRNKCFYCETCNRNLSISEIQGLCSCGNKTKVKFMGLSGKLYYYCSDSTCKKTRVMSFDNSMRTRFSRINPYGKKMQQKRQLVCRVCGSNLSGETVINMSLYSGDVNLARNYREDFFYHAFGPAKKNNDISIVPENVAILKDIDRHYEKGSTKFNPVSVTDESIRIHFKTSNKSINELLIQFNIALAQNVTLKLKSSEGIIILLDAAKSPSERQSVIDHFMVDLEHLNTKSSEWINPVLIGLCCNDVEELESEINSGIIKSADDSEEICIKYLSSQNNGDIIQSLYNRISNVHFFVYRTGTLALGNDSNVYNIVPPVQSLFYSASSDFSNIWKPTSGGYCPKTAGHK